MAIDYNGVITAIKGAADESTESFRPVSAVTSTAPRAVQHDAGETLLHSAGYGGGKKLTLWTHLHPGVATSTLATLLKSDLAALDIDLNVPAMTRPTQYAKARSTNPSQRQDILHLLVAGLCRSATWFLNSSRPRIRRSTTSRTTRTRRSTRRCSRSSARRPAPAKAQALYKTMQSMLHARRPGHRHVHRADQRILRLDRRVCRQSRLPECRVRLRSEAKG